MEGWERTFERNPDYPQLGVSGRLLREEIRGITGMLADLVDVPPGVLSPHQEAAQKRQRHWFPKVFRREVGLKECIKAGGTLFGTLDSLLDAVPWLKALLTIGHEAADVATDG